MAQHRRLRGLQTAWTSPLRIARPMGEIAHRHQSPCPRKTSPATSCPHEVLGQSPRDALDLTGSGWSCTQRACSGTMRTPRSGTDARLRSDAAPLRRAPQEFSGNRVIHTKCAARPLRTGRTSQTWARVNNELAPGRCSPLVRIHPMGSSITDTRCLPLGTSSASMLAARGIELVSRRSRPHKLGITSDHREPKLERWRSSLSSTAHDGVHAQAFIGAHGA